VFDIVRDFEPCHRAPDVMKQVTITASETLGTLL